MDSFLLFCLLLVSCLRPSWGSLQHNMTMPDMDLDFSGLNSDESESELSSQLQEIDERSNGWSGWSSWSPCSRSCDGGVVHQIRTCRNGPCRGDHVRYKICNMQPCPDSPPEFRAEQCASFDDLPFEGGMYRWQPFYDDDEPCALTCKGKLKGASDDALLVVARLQEKVHDGTRCRPGSLDMCIDGRCERVGCDLKIGSEKQVDECGVCGGDGSTCAKPLYHWALTHASLCSVTCGGGYKMSRPVCQNRVTGVEVEEELCNDSQKPDSTVVECNTHTCPPRWHVGEWGACSTSCGGGIRLRPVYCVEEMNGTKLRVDESKCNGGRKPWFQEACNRMDCPTWFTSKWSGCSVSCGEGIQTRMVECKDTSGEHSDLCDVKIRPETTQACSTGITCPFRVDTSEELLPGLYQTPLEQTFPAPPMPERLVGGHVVPSESTTTSGVQKFIAEEWNPCSVTCGEGIRRREVHCKIFLEFSRTVAKLPDKQCSGIKPVEVEKCYREPCTEPVEMEKIDDIGDDPSNVQISGSASREGGAKSYSWKEQGFTHCSASCLGGVQELIVNCVRDDNQKITSPYMCPIEYKPEVIIRSCNEHACPPRWQYGDFSPCSLSCGLGIQTREVNCVHELTQGGGNSVVVPHNRCPQPPPPDRQYCNVLDCPVKWRVSEWSKCTKPCGGGEKSRKVECKQVMAQNHTVDRPSTMCPSPKPLETKPCNTKSCVIESDKPQISVTNSTFIQHDPKKNKITVKVGGAATLLTGTTVKIKCPVKRFDKSKIQWKKDGTALPHSKKYKSSKKGALRVQNLSLRDSGVYSCVAGKSNASITISVRTKPGEFPTSEEIQKHYKTDLISGVHVSQTEGKPNYADDQSHEQKPDGGKKNHYKLFTPTSPSSSLTLETHANGAKTTENSDNKKDKVSNLPSSSSEFHNTPNRDGGGAESARSSATRPTSTFGNLFALITKLQDLWPFPIFKFEPLQSRGHRMVTFPVNTHQIPPTTDQTMVATASSDEVQDVVLGKGTKENLVFEWTLSDWSGCSETCGGAGLQKRSCRCTVKLHNSTQYADDNLCEDAGIEKPKTTRKCGFDECPNWTVTEWTLCENSKCFSLNKAMQRRTVKCQIARNLTLDVSQCRFDEKPHHRQECFNEKCVGKWKVGSWSKCNAKCGTLGEKYRTFHCVWYGTKKNAGSACKNVPRPLARKTCKGPPCENTVGCKDLSVFCPNVKSLDLCKIVQYRQQCCHTCKNND
ncbi:protein madd-4 [Anthonomus grandis grandis]|uniref:protein madd-4 n=1 Tax=Anthonomus grandis grandis TaxID=2921223 RepID=UPI0021652CED|nr:protein madd-4 [Anthonomus grandis grandis]